MLARSFGGGTAVFTGEPGVLNLEQRRLAAGNAGGQVHAKGDSAVSSCQDPLPTASRGRSDAVAIAGSLGERPHFQHSGLARLGQQALQNMALDQQPALSSVDLSVAGAQELVHSTHP